MLECEPYSFRWLLQTQPDLLISLDFRLLISEGSWSSDFLVWSVAKWQHVPVEPMTVRVWQGSEVWVFDFPGSESWMAVYYGVVVSMAFPGWMS